MARRAFTLFPRSAYSSTLKTETIFSSETSVDFQLTTRHYILQNSDRIDSKQFESERQ
jgi:hypothetical protein